MAVAPDTDSAWQVATTGAGSTINSSNVSGALVNSIAIVAFAFNATSSAISGTPTYNGSNMTAVGGASFNGSSSAIEFWYILNPTSGVNSINFAWSGAAAACQVIASSFSNVNQVSPVSNVAVNSDPGNSNTSATVTVTSIVGDYTWSVIMCNAGSPSIGDISPGLIATDNAHARGITAGKAAGASPNVAFTATLSSGFGGWNAIAIDLAAAGSAGPTTLGIQGMASSEWKRKPFVGWDMLRDHRWRKQRSLLIPNKTIIHPQKMAA